jgi:hypothetical protein
MPMHRSDAFPAGDGGYLTGVANGGVADVKVNIGGRCGDLGMTVV